jgi:hypothetical protein
MEAANCWKTGENAIATLEILLTRLISSWLQTSHGDPAEVIEPEENWIGEFRALLFQLCTY